MSRHLPPPDRDRSEYFRECGWIQTYTGKKFSLFEPRAQDVDIIDIAVALARVPRFAGHTRYAYSVAQHSYYASLLVPMKLGLEGLLHDASEAYTGDVTRPLKILLGSAFAEIEGRVHAVICERFGISPAMSPAVKEADDRLLAAERRDLMPTPPEPWMSLEQVKPAAIRIQPCKMHAAISQFLHRFAYLTGQELDYLDRIPAA